MFRSVEFKFQTIEQFARDKNETCDHKMQNSKTREYHLGYI